jgi:hypothetical protein
MVLPLGDLEKTRIVPLVTYLLIATNVVAYVVQREEGDDFTIAYAATPYEITHDVDIPAPVVVGAADHETQTATQPPPQVIDKAPGPEPRWV